MAVRTSHGWQPLRSPVSKGNIKCIVGEFKGRISILRSEISFCYLEGILTRPSKGLPMSAVQVCGHKYP